MSKAGTIIAFLSGVAVGGIAVWYYTKEKYSEIAEQEIYSAKEAFRERERKINDDLTEVRRRFEELSKSYISPDDSIDEQNTERNKRTYTDYSRSSVLKQTEITEKEPYVISPEEFGEGEYSEYAQVTYLYFEDGVMADERGIVVENPEELIGSALDIFERKDEDSVYCRNDDRRCEYEILRELGTYEDFRKTLPPNI